MGKWKMTEKEEEEEERKKRDPDTSLSFFKKRKKEIVGEIWQSGASPLRYPLPEKKWKKKKRK